MSRNSSKEEDKKAHAKYMREWRTRHAVRINEQARERWRDDPSYVARRRKTQKEQYRKTREKVLKRVAKYQWDKRERYLAYQRAYAKRNSKKNVERARQWKKNNPEKAKANALDSEGRRRAIKAGGDATGCSALIHRWKAAKTFTCKGCGQRCITKGALHIDHILPLSRGGAHAPYNLQKLCIDCKLRKAHNDEVPRNDNFVP